MSMPILDGSQVIFYLYTPSDAAAYAFLSFFALSTVAHIGFAFFHRTWHFIPLIIGGVSETFAYYGRAWSHSDPHHIRPWVLQSMLIFVAPVFLAATTYIALCRIIVAMGAEEHSIIRPRWLAKLYILVDILVFISQIAGIGLQITGDEKVMEIGNKAIAGGLGVQFVMLFFFGAIAARVFRRWKWAATEKPAASPPNTDTKTTRYFVAIYVAAVAIALRSLVRLAEFAQGERGAIASHEIFLYLFDSVPMLLVMVVFLVVHPGKLIRQCAAKKSTEAVPLVGPWH